MDNVAPLFIRSSIQPEANNAADNPEQLLASTLRAFEQWRAEKKKSGEPIPEPLWQQIFSLEPFYSPSQLRRIFTISTRQYQSKKESNSPNRLALSTSDKTMPINNTSTPPPKLCEIKIKTNNPYATEPLPSTKTLVVEFCRQDGQIMKIHTTQDSIPTLMHTFLGGS